LVLWEKFRRNEQGIPPKTEKKERKITGGKEKEKGRRRILSKNRKKGFRGRWIRDRGVLVRPERTGSG